MAGGSVSGSLYFFRRSATPLPGCWLPVSNKGSGDQFHFSTSHSTRQQQKQHDRPQRCSCFGRFQFGRLAAAFRSADRLIIFSLDIFKRYSAERRRTCSIFNGFGHLLSEKCPVRHKRCISLADGLQAACSGPKNRCVRRPKKGEKRQK